MAEISPLQAYMAANQKRIDQLSQPQQQGLDPLMMLAVAQGFLSPTRTGSFGESIGNAAGQAIGPLSKARAADAERLDKIDKLRETQVRLALEQQRINDLNARAAAGYDRDPILDYSRLIDRLKTQYELVGDPEAYDLDASTPEGKAEKERRIQDRALIKNRIDALTSRYVDPLIGGGAAKKGNTGEGGGTRAPQPSAAVGAARPGQTGLVPTEEELKNARVKNGVKYIERGGQYYRVEE